MSDQFEAKGINGQLTVTPDRVIITRKGLLAFASQGLKGNKEINIKSISSIQIKNPGALTNGYIQFAYLGSQESKGGIFDAGNDENSILFNRKQEKDFLHAKALIEQYQSASPGSADSTIHDSGSLSDLEKLAELRDKGIISEADFQAKKNKILGI